MPHSKISVFQFIKFSYFAGNQNYPPPPEKKKELGPTCAIYSGGGQ